MPKLDASTIDVRTGSGYPSPYDKPCLERRSERLSDAGGLTQFGVHRCLLSPGAWSSQRHWHTHEDELVYILQGTPILVDDNGETQLVPGDVTTHAAGEPNGHHMINRTDTDVVFLIVGTRNPMQDTGHYPDINLKIPANGTANRHFTDKEEKPYPR
ncbi:MAG: cupin domain-containing protein [Granulosicoccus sp.]